MKKIIYTILICFLFGCTIQETENSQPNSMTVQTIVATIESPTKAGHINSGESMHSLWEEGDTITVVVGREVRYYVADNSGSTTSFHPADEDAGPLKMFDDDKVFALVGRFEIKDYTYALTNKSINDYSLVQPHNKGGMATLPMDFMRAEGKLQSGVVHLSFTHILSYIHLQIPKSIILENNFKLYFHALDCHPFQVKNPNEVPSDVDCLVGGIWGGDAHPLEDDWKDMSKEYGCLLLNLRRGCLLSYYGDGDYSYMIGTCPLSFSEESIQEASDYVDVIVAIDTHDKAPWLPMNSSYFYITSQEDRNQVLLSKYVSVTALEPNNYYEANMEEPYTSIDYSKDGNVEIVQRASIGQGVDLIFMGDGFSDRMIERGEYKETLDEAVNGFFSIEPYRSFQDYFNIYYVTLVSCNEVFGNTALKNMREDDTISGDNPKCFEYALKAISDEQMDDAVIIVSIPRTSVHGTAWLYRGESYNDYGSGASIAYVYKGTDYPEDFAFLIHHEAGGHAFAKLLDEYVSIGGIIKEDEKKKLEEQSKRGWYKNIDFTNDPSKVKWSRFIFDNRYQDENLGCYEGALYGKGIFRPSETSVMRKQTKESGIFNAPSREAIYYRINKLAFGENWEYDYETFVKFDLQSKERLSSSWMVKREERDVTYSSTPVVMNKNWRDE